LRFSERSFEFRAQLAALALAQLQVIELSQLLAQCGDDGGSRVFQRGSAQLRPCRRCDTRLTGAQKLRHAEC